MDAFQSASFSSSIEITKSNSKTINAPRSALARFPSLVLSRRRGTVLVVRSSDMNPTEPSVQMSWTGEDTQSPPAAAVVLPPSCVTRSCLVIDLHYSTDMRRRAYRQPRWSILSLQKLKTHVAYDFSRRHHLRIHVLRSICLLYQIRGCRGFGKRRYRAILADNHR
jgi:hypothetical protein